MLLMSTWTWIIIGVGVVILAVFIGTKIKDRYFQKAAGCTQRLEKEGIEDSGQRLAYNG